jgi:hypothetical protein
VPSAQAQVLTTSTLSGSVSSEQNQLIKGASLTVTHVPTGTVYTTTSRDDGSFSLSGLRPGGPYKIAVQSEGNQVTEMSDVYLEIDQGANVAIHVRPANVTVMDRVDVTTSAIDNLFDVTQTGSGTYANSRQISDTPAGDRSINSLARLDPRVTYNRDPQDRAISVNGISNRYNMIQVDGVSASDPFGLNSNNTAAERNVIPLDSLEALSINTSPYYSRNAGFTGAQINSITKSGTNEYKGSVYYTFRGRSLPLFGRDIQMVGDEMDQTAYPISKFDEQTIGATLGGPILKNKLFFYIAYEDVKEDRVAPKPTTSLDDATIKQITDAAIALGFKPGSATPPSGNRLTDKNLLTKLDWQINNNHRATFRYNRAKWSRPTYPLFGDGVSQNNFSFDSDWYTQDGKNESYIGQFISRWNEKLNTEVSYSHSAYHSEPTNATRQPYVQINNIAVPGSSNTAYAAFGTEYSRHFNILDVKNDTMELYGSYQLTDKHLLQFGYQYDKNDVYNAYVQYCLGYYRYNSLSDFLTKAATGGASGQYNYNKIDPNVDAAANFTEANSGFFINDKWRVLPGVSLDVGGRIDTALLPDAIPYNALFNQVFGMRNDYSYDGKSIFQPRLGFNWQPAFAKKTIIRGGVGLFYGRMPRVWMGNSYSNTGANYVAYQNTTLPAISANPDNQPTSGTSPAQQVAFVNPGFQLPSRWKTNLAVDRELGFWDLKGSVEFEKSIVRKDVFYSNINIQPTATGPDGREMYFSNYTKAVTVNSTSGAASGGSSGTQTVDPRFTNRIIRLGNTGKGETQAATFSIERPLKSDGWYWKASYVNTKAEEVLMGTSSVASSNWNNRAVFNANTQELHRAELEIKHRILINVAKDFQFFKGYKTTVSTLIDCHSGLPYSFVFSGDANGDGTTGNDLLFVPKRGDYSAARFATATDEANFYRIVDLYRLTEGQRVDANDHRYPWVNTVDLSLKQQIKLPGWRHHLTLGLDILNIGNMLNSRWGVIRGSNQFYVKRESVATVNFDGTTKQYVYSKVSSDLANGKFAPSKGRGEPAATRWSVLVSARYEF